MYEVAAGRGRRVNRRQYKHVCGRAPHRRAQRQESAKARQAVYEALSVEEKLLRIASRPGASRKEHDRLIEQIRAV